MKKQTTSTMNEFYFDSHFRGKGTKRDVKNKNAAQVTVPGLSFPVAHNEVNKIQNSSALGWRFHFIDMITAKCHNLNVNKLDSLLSKNWLLRKRVELKTMFYSIL